MCGVYLLYQIIKSEDKSNITMAKNEQTSPKMAKVAAKVLSNPNSSKVSKSLAGALLTQAPNKKK